MPDCRNFYRKWGMRARFASWMLDGGGIGAGASRLPFPRCETSARRGQRYRQEQVLLFRSLLIFAKFQV